MKPGESFVGQPIRSLQTMLRTISQTDPDQPSVILDGVYNQQTSDAVRAFQQNNNLESTGVVNQNTWELVVSTYKTAKIVSEPAEAIYVTINPGQVFCKGNHHPQIYLTQARLMVLSEAYPGFPIPVINGVLDEATAKALMALQILSDLPATGDLDKQTWRFLVLQHAQASDKLSRGLEQEI